MSVTVELTYEMGKRLGAHSFQVDAASSVADVVRAARERFGEHASEFETLSRVAAVAVNGVLVNYRKGLKTPLADGDRVSFVKAAAGG
jgi:molybdopterin converting factor small subunit